MAFLKLDRFSGEIPRLNRRLLPTENAQTATNTKLWSGIIKAFGGATVEDDTLAKTGPILSAYLFDSSKWFHWASDVDVVRSPIPLNTNNRTYFTDGSYMKYTDDTVNGGADYPTNSYRVGITVNGSTTPAPSVGGTASDSDNVESRVYVYTWVRTWNNIAEESEPSDPSASIDLTPGDTCNLTGLPTTAPIGSQPGGAVWTKRIYRTVTGTSTTEYLYVTSVSLATASYNDSALSEALGETLPSLTWSEPPDDLVGLTPLPNGVLAAFRRNELWLSEPYQPHAWPVDYQLATDDDIVAIGAFGESLVVATTGYPYVVTGVDPAAVSMGKIELAQACVNKRSMVDLGPYVVYASPDGLVSVGQGTAKVITQDFMTRDEWQALDPSTIHGYRYDNRYIGFYDNGTPGGFIFDPDEGNSALVFLDEYYDTGYCDLETDTLYLVDGTSSPVVYSWDTNSSAPLTFVWKSKLMETPAPISLGAAQILGTQDNSSKLTFKLYADGALRYTRTDIATNDGFRLPSGFLARDWEIEITGTADVEAVLLATTMRELRQA